jgi:hypothetical protein
MPLLRRCHTFRATGITAYLASGGALEHAQEMAAQSAREGRSYPTARRNGSPRTRWREYGFETAGGSFDYCFDFVLAGVPEPVTSRRATQGY